MAGGPRQLCLAILDLDHFKQINDLHGHSVGDEVLRAIGRAVSDHLRQDDFVARFGGDEFGLLLWVPTTRPRRRSSSGCGRSVPGDTPVPACPARTASVGYRLAGRGRSSPPCPAPSRFIRRPTPRLREAKQQGRDRTVG